MKLRVIASVLALGVGGFGGAAQAAPVTFFGEGINNSGDPAQAPFTNADAARASFFSNLVGVGTETFESYASGTNSPLGVSFGAAGTATLNGGSVDSGNNGVGRYPKSGSKYWDAGSDNFSISFSAPIAAFGFYGMDVGDFGGQLTLTLTDINDNISVLVVPNTIGSSGSTTGSNLYFGFYDLGNTYKSIVFGNNSGGADFFGFDDFSIGSLEQVVPTIPEPGTWAMMIIGFGLAGAAIRRRRTTGVTAIA